MITKRHPSSPRIAPNLVRWGAVFAGTVISLGFFALLSSLWLAIAYSDVDAGGWVSGNLAWFLGATAVAALFLAGLLSGYLSGVRGAGSGLLNGLTAWGLLFVASVLTVVPGLTAITTRLGAGIGAGTNTIGGAVGPAGGGVTAESAVWTTFWSLLVGAIVAALGGIAGGAAKREAKIADTDVRGEDEVYPVAPVAGGGVTETRVVAGGREEAETSYRR
jgi:hypothetical protein